MITFEVRIDRFAVTKEAAQAALQEALGIEAALAARVVASVPVTVKRGVSQAEAVAFARVLSQLGAEVAVVPAQPAAAAAPRERRNELVRALLDAGHAKRAAAPRAAPSIPPLPPLAEPESLPPLLPPPEPALPTVDSLLPPPPLASTPSGPLSLPPTPSEPAPGDSLPPVLFGGDTGASDSLPPALRSDAGDSLPPALREPAPEAPFAGGPEAAAPVDPAPLPMIRADTFAERAIRWLEATQDFVGAPGAWLRRWASVQLELARPRRGVRRRFTARERFDKELAEFVVWSLDVLQALAAWVKERAGGRSGDKE